MTTYSKYARCPECFLTQGTHAGHCPNHPDSWAEYIGVDAPDPHPLPEQYEPIGREELAELAALACKLDLVLTPFMGAFLIQRGGNDGR